MILVLLVACSPEATEVQEAAEPLMPAPYAPPEAVEGTPLTVEEAKSGFTTAFSNVHQFGINRVVRLYVEGLSLGDGTCPPPPDSDGFWSDICETVDGIEFSGKGSSKEAGCDAEGVEIKSAFNATTPEGERWDVAGHGSSSDCYDADTERWSGDSWIRGTFHRPDTESWLGTASFVEATYEATSAQSVLATVAFNQLDGGAVPTFRAELFSASAGSQDCAFPEPWGTLELFDEGLRVWHEARFHGPLKNQLGEPRTDEMCDGCADLLLAGEEAGTLCVEVDHLLDWSELPWRQQ